MMGERRRTVFLPAWLPIACWPGLVVLALGGGYLGGGAAVTCAIAAIAIGTALTWAASGTPDPPPGPPELSPAAIPIGNPPTPHS
jgi:hypothetical protein